ncbi:MAG: EamA family transporter [Methanomassiliicoccales archaeon]|nr:EamA family transporter [Methanomassiliicoccales archaeon]
MKAKHEAALIASSFIWGTSFVSAKIGVEHVDPFLFSLLRFALASFVLLLILIVTKRFSWRLFENKLIWAIAGFNAVALELQHLGMTMTSATNAVLLIDINVVFVAIIAFFILVEEISKKVILGLASGLIGVVIVSTNGDLSAILTGSFLGNVMVFCAGVLWAFYIVYQKEVLMREQDILLVTCAVILTTTIILLPLTFLFTGDYQIDVPGGVSAIYTGIICTSLAFLLYNYGLKGMGATMASIILLLEIIFAMIFAFLILQEIPTVATWIGGGFIIFAIAVISMNRNRK